MRVCVCVLVCKYVCVVNVVGPVGVFYFGCIGPKYRTSQEDDQRKGPRGIRRGSK